MQVRVLGAIEVLRPVEVSLGGPTRRRALALLAFHTNQVVSLDQLIDATWPNGDTPDRAEHNVQSYVHRLRTALRESGDRIETVGAGYRLRLDRAELDATRFEGLLAQSRSAEQESDPERARLLIDEALETWRGVPYEEFADEEWVRAEVVRLTELRASAVERRFEALLAKGRHTEVIGPLREAVDAEPWRETRRVQLALALYRAGRHAEALRVIQDYRTQLAEELGLDPSPDVAALEHRILDHDPGLMPPSHRQHSLRGYELDEVIGEGAFSLVWRGVQPALSRTVAVKQIRAGVASQPDFIRRFETEAQTVATLEHPHIVPLYDFWREPDNAYLVMRFVAGGSLESEVLQRGLDDARLRRLVEQVGAALHTAHRVGVIHRDVKSASVLLDDDGNFYLTDFGIAFTGSLADDELATALSTGSPAYASPEQLRRQSLDLRTDVHAFGITLFEAATGRLPPTSGSARGRSGRPSRFDSWRTASPGSSSERPRRTDRSTTPTSSEIGCTPRTGTVFVLLIRQRWSWRTIGSSRSKAPPSSWPLVRGPRSLRGHNQRRRRDRHRQRTGVGRGLRRTARSRHPARGRADVRRVAGESVPRRHSVRQCGAVARVTLGFRRTLELRHSLLGRDRVCRRRPQHDP
jgi:serine/threonine protein kinase/DNA-binding winged helix-turn-helix (wHTH) protein